MMKSFFKKLAFVMALAMVVSMAAPAATTASAASNLKIAYQNGSAISEVNIAKVGGTEDLKFVGAPSDWKTLGAKWSSNNEAVATVDKAGVVTAVSAGTAVIAVQVGAEQATVKVNVVDLPVYTATMGTTENKNITELTLDKVGAEFDLAFFGIKDYDKNRYNCDWYSVDENVATVDEKGLVKATGEGKTKISLGVYNVVTGKKHKVDSCTVVVGAAEPTKAPVDKDAFTVAQKDTDKFVITFEEAKTADQIKENLTVSVKIGDQDFPISFENVTVDGKTATVTTYANFENDEVYTLTYGKEVVKHTIVLGEIANVGVKYYTGKNPENTFAYVTEEEENDYVTLVPVLFDKYGNDITAKYDLTTITFSYEVSDNVVPNCNYNDTYSFGAAGVATVNVTAGWVTDGGDYKEVTGKTSFQVLKRGSIGLSLVKSGLLDTDDVVADDDIDDIALVNDDKYTYYTSPKASFQFDPNSKLWSKAGTTVMYKAEDTRDLVFSAVVKDNRGNVVTTNTSSYKFGYFIYESTNSEVLTVADTTGEVEVNGTGRANVLVYFVPADGTDTKKLVASTMITVTPQTYPVSYKMTQALATKASHVVFVHPSEEIKDKFLAVYTEDEYAEILKAAPAGDWEFADKGIDKATFNSVDLTKEEKDTFFSIGALNSANYGLNDGEFKVQFLDQNGKPYRNDELIELMRVEARDSKNNVGVMGDATWDKWGKCYVLKIDASQFAEEFISRDDVGTIIDTNRLNSKTYSYKLTLDESDLTEKIKTPYAVFSLVVKNTFDECDKITDFIEDGDVAPNYKFNIGFGGNQTVDVAVKNVIDYTNTEAKNTEKHTYWSTQVNVKYLSTGNLEISNVPVDKLVRFGTGATAANEKLKTGDVGYVYYKISAPSKVMVAGVSEDNNAWKNQNRPGVVDFFFNKTSAEPETFKYAATGNYTVSFYTTRKDDAAFNNIATRTITIKNTQSEVKYLGLNPEFNGVTETFDSIDEFNLVNVVREQLRFSYEDLFIGDFYTDTVGDGYDMNIKLRTEVPGNPDANPQPKVHFADDGKSVTITALYFDVILDDGTTKYTYTSVVSVGARIKVK